VRDGCEAAANRGRLAKSQADKRLIGFGLRPKADLPLILHEFGCLIANGDYLTFPARAVRLSLVAGASAVKGIRAAAVAWRRFADYGRMVSTLAPCGLRPWAESLAGRPQPVRPSGPVRYGMVAVETKGGDLP
jgi:hypothetical protein